jgi:ketosteroid isomerase-like protein
MSAESAASPDLVALTRQSMDASNRREFDVAATMFAPDAVFDVSSVGLGRFEGAAAIHGYLADWYSSYEEQELRHWEGHDLGGGVVFVVALFQARPLGSQSSVREQWAFTLIWAGQEITRVVASRDIDGARAAAERLAEERK